MAGKQHESRPDHEMVRKNQVSDESGNKELKIDGFVKEDIPYPRYTHNTAAKDEDFVETGVHFYTLSIMNESNKVFQRI